MYFEPHTQNRLNLDTRQQQSTYDDTTTYGTVLVLTCVIHSTTVSTSTVQYDEQHEGLTTVTGRVSTQLIMVINYTELHICPTVD